MWSSIEVIFFLLTAVDELELSHAYFFHEEA